MVLSLGSVRVYHPHYDGYLRPDMHAGPGREGWSDLTGSSFTRHNPERHVREGIHGIHFEGPDWAIRKRRSTIRKLGTWMAGS